MIHILRISMSSIYAMVNVLDALKLHGYPQKLHHREMLEIFNKMSIRIIPMFEDEVGCKTRGDFTAELSKKLKFSCKQEEYCTNLSMKSLLATDLLQLPPKNARTVLSRRLTTTPQMLRLSFIIFKYLQPSLVRNDEVMFLGRLPFHIVHTNQSTTCIFIHKKRDLVLVVFEMEYSGIIHSPQSTI